MSDPRPLASLVEEILQRGETLDAHERLNRNRGVVHLLSAQVAATFIEGATSDVRSLDDLTVAMLSDSFSYPALSMAATAVAAMTYGLARRSERRRVREAEQRQVAIREILGEPVDVLRFYPKSEPVPAVRWYGLDGLPPGTPVEFVARRFQRLLDATAGTGLDNFVFSSGVLSTFIDVDAGQFGRTMANRTAVKRRAEISDLRADQTIVGATRWQCEKILTELKKQVGGNALEQLAAVIQEGDRQTRIPAAVAEVDPATGAGLLELARVIERELVTAEEESPVVQRYRDEQGIPRRARAQVQARVVGDRIETTNVYRDASGTEQQSPEGARSLLSTTGEASLEELIASLTQNSTGRDRIQRNADAKVALLLTTRRLLDMSRAAMSLELDDTTAPSVATARVAPLAAESKVPTFFQRVMREPPRTFPRLRRHGAVDRGSEPTIEYRGRGVRRKDKIAYGVVVPLLFPAAYSLGMLTTTAEDSLLDRYERSHTRAMARHEIYPSVSLEDFISDRAGTGTKVYLGAMDKLEAVRETLDGVALRGVRAAGVPDGTIAAIQEWIDSHSSQAPAPPPPPTGSVYADENGNVGVGDVDSANNGVVFQVSGTDGAATGGFWYTNVNNLASASPRELTFPFKNVGVEFTSLNTASREVESLSAAPPDGDEAPVYTVTGQLRAGASQNVNLPIKSGTKVVAIKISGTGSSKVVVPTVRQDIDTGTYKTFIAKDDIAGMASPKLQYWLGSDPNNVVRARGPIFALGSPKYVLDEFSEVPLPNYQPLSRVMSADQRARVVRSLGLAAEASSREILAALRDKNYSYTPVKDGGGKPTLSVDPKDINSAEVFTAVGESVGGLDDGNCNTSGTSFIFGTGGRFEGEDLNIAAGFNDDGDGILTSLEAHTLAVSTSGVPVDPTPRNHADVTKRHSLATNETLLKAMSVLRWGAAGFTGLVATGALWRRRKSAKDFVDKVGEKLADERFSFLDDDEHRKTAALRDAITVLDVIRWAPPEVSITAELARSRRRGSEGRSVLDRLETEALTPPTPGALVERELSAREVKLPRATRKALNQLTEPPPSGPNIVLKKVLRQAPAADSTTERRPLIKAAAKRSAKRKTTG